MDAIKARYQDNKPNNVLHTPRTFRNQVGGRHVPIPLLRPDRHTEKEDEDLTIETKLSDDVLSALLIPGSLRNTSKLPSSQHSVRNSTVRNSVHTLVSEGIKQQILCPSVSFCALHHSGTTTATLSACQTGQLAETTTATIPPSPTKQIGQPQGTW